MEGKVIKQIWSGSLGLGDYQSIILEMTDGSKWLFTGGTVSGNDVVNCTDTNEIPSNYEIWPSDPESNVKKERIICSAIHYQNENKPSGPFAPKNIKTGYVLCGRRHHNIIESNSILTGRVTREEDIQGFLTSDDRFVTRQEAFIIAKEVGQILDMGNTRGERLYSEDLY